MIRFAMFAFLLGAVYLIATTPVADEVRVLNETVIPAQGGWLPWSLLGMLGVGPLYAWARGGVAVDDGRMLGYGIMLGVALGLMCVGYRYMMAQHTPAVTPASDWVTL